MHEKNISFLNMVALLRNMTSLFTYLLRRQYKEYDSVFEWLNAFISKRVQETGIPEHVVSAPIDTVSQAIRLECSAPPFIHSLR